MNADDTLALSPEPSDEPREEPVFDIGERTIFQMRNQPWSFDEFGTIVLRAPKAGSPGDETAAEEAHTLATSEAAPAPESPVAAPSIADPLARIEQKLDATLRALESLKRRVESLDATIARIVSR